MVEEILLRLHVMVYVVSSVDKSLILASSSANSHTLTEFELMEN